MVQALGESTIQNLNFTVFIVNVDLSQMAENEKNKGTLFSQTVKDGDKTMIS